MKKLPGAAWLLACFCGMVFEINALAFETPTRVWIDTDPALGMIFRDADDGFALLQALHGTGLEIAGISVVRGNAEVPTGLRIAKEIVENCQRWHSLAVPPIFAGKISMTAEPSAAARALRAALGDKLTYISLGPLTNLQEFLRYYPERAKNIERVVFLGGEWPGTVLRAEGWNPYHFTDANFYKNPLAFAALLETNIPITLVPIDLARGIGISPERMRFLRRQNGCAGWVARRAGGWFLGWRLIFGVRDAPIFDALPLLTVITPKEVQSTPAICRLEIGVGKPRLGLYSPEEASKFGIKRCVTVINGFSKKAAATSYKLLVPLCAQP